jgi:hypothetical protein
LCRWPLRLRPFQGVKTFLTGVGQAGDVVGLDNPRWRQAKKRRIAELPQAVSHKKDKCSSRQRQAVRRHLD